MTPQELKNSILQLAIQGKLVEQHPEEGTAEELYQQIQAEKQALIKAGKIKKEKPLPEITEDEKPFDIPDSWKWVRLASITYNFGQTTPSSKFCYVDVGSVDNKQHKLNDEETIVEAKDASSRAKKIVNFGDVIFATIRPYLQNICIIDRQFSYEPIVSTAFAVMSCPNGLLNKFLFYALLSPSFMEYANATDKAKGVAYPAIGEKDFFNGIIPLPPLAEQKRIVAKIEELLPLIDRYEEAWTKLEEFNKRFPGDMQKSLLQMAIQGKLVEQCPEEGTGEELYHQIQTEKQALIKSGKIKKDKSLPEISDDEKPFDIPEGWKWVRLGEILTSTDAGKSPQCEDRSRSGNEWGVIKTTAIQNGFFLPEENKVLPEKFAVQEGQIVHCGDLLITRAGPRNRTGVLCVVSDEPTNLILSDKTVRLSYIKGLVEPLFIMYMLNSPAGQVSIIGAMTGMAASQVNISQDSMKKFLLALPPLAEQKRIVAKLEELLPLCERLK